MCVRDDVRAPAVAKGMAVEDVKGTSHVGASSSGLFSLR